VDRTARHLHAIWQRQQGQDRWRHAAAPDREQRTDPALICFDSLPAEARERRREEVREALRGMIVQGFDLSQIEPTQPTTG
jgi:hypothetical protein